MSSLKEALDIRSKLLIEKFGLSKFLTINKSDRVKLSLSEAMALAIVEAYRGATWVSPNPLVGCIILDKEGFFIGKGYHQRYGGPHAEINALENLNLSDLKEAHVIVTLEPCAHQGKTPSCAKKLSQLPIAKVTYGLKDPNPLVSGQGHHDLVNNGKEVSLYSPPDFLSDLTLELESLAEVFLYNYRAQKCFVALKWAQSIDGKMALSNGLSQWITNSLSRDYAHYLRSIYDATMVGANTIVMDDPKLNIRLHSVAKKNKIIIFDPSGKVFLQRNRYQFNKIHDEENIFYILEDSCRKNEAISTILNSLSVVSKNIIFMKKENQKFNLSRLNQNFYNLGLRSVLVEGGAKTIQYFISEGQWNRMYCFIAPILLGQGLSYTSELNLNSMDAKIRLLQSINYNFENDILISGRSF